MTGWFASGGHAGRERRRLALLAGIVAATASISKVHATGTYGMWWLSLLLYGLIAADTREADPAPFPRPA